jgi:hypothetical protein
MADQEQTVEISQEEQIAAYSSVYSFKGSDIGEEA